MKEGFGCAPAISLCASASGPRLRGQRSMRGDG